MNSPVLEVAEVPLGVVTLTFTVPDPAGEVAVISVELSTVKFSAALEPNMTSVAPVRFKPVMVTDAPPPAGPEAGDTPVTTGAASLDVEADS